MRIRIYPEKCIGVGQCVTAAADLFAQNDEDGIAYLLREDVPEDRRQAARTAARLCPTLAIEIHER